MKLLCSKLTLLCFTIKYTSLINSPCLFHRKCKENSVENMNTNVLGC